LEKGSSEQLKEFVMTRLKDEVIEEESGVVNDFVDDLEKICTKHFGKCYQFKFDVDSDSLQIVLTAWQE
tara:strand:+ start:116 stop:322 length:207 start_codon:yes stop_codon:yes gene_type:complete